MCVGQALEALGEFQSAARVYSKFEHHERAAAAEKILLEKLPFWRCGPKKRAFSLTSRPIKNIEVLDSWEVNFGIDNKGGKPAAVPEFAILLEMNLQPDDPTAYPSKLHRNVVLMYPGKSISSAPLGSELWTVVKAIPNFSPTEFGVLVIDTCPPGNDMVSSAAFGRMFAELSGKSIPPPGPIELWAVQHESLKWRRVSVRGTVPEQGSFMKSHGTNLVHVGNSVFLMRADPGDRGMLMCANLKDYGVSVLDLTTLTWTPKLSHPFHNKNPYYRSTASVPLLLRNPRLATLPSLPAFPNVWSCYASSVGGVPAIAMVQSGDIAGSGGVVVPERQSEIVPKYSIGYLLLYPSQQPAWVWNVPTSDLSGHRADGLQGAVVSVSDFLVTINYGRSHGTLTRMGEDGRVNLDFSAPTTPSSASFNQLDILTSTFEWRKPVVANSFLLEGRSVGQIQSVVHDERRDSLWVFYVDKTEDHSVGSFCMSNVSNLLKVLKKVSKNATDKSTVRYQFEKMKKHAAEPLKQCAFCGGYETPGGLKFKRCAQCTGPSYCGKDCQRKHWKSHKVVCQQQATAATSAAAAVAPPGPVAAADHAAASQGQEEAERQEEAAGDGKEEASA